MASWTRRVSVETLKTISPVLASVSKNPTSCFKTASKYFFLSVLTCLSPVYIQHEISVKNFEIFIARNRSNSESDVYLVFKIMLKEKQTTKDRL